MTRADFDRLVQRIESGVGRRPRALRLRALWWALVGYGAIALVCGALIGLGGLFLAVAIEARDPQGSFGAGLFGLVLVGVGGKFLYGIARLPVRPPEGCVVTAEDAPQLFAALEELRERLNAAPFHAVQLYEEFNACVVHVPRLGLLGWPRNYLLLGLPLMDALSPDEMRAVLAHEFAHLSRRHGRVNHWLYRVRRSWERIFEGSATGWPRGSFQGVKRQFVEWFWPRFNAHAFVLSRADEYEADATAAALVGARPLASSLARLKVLDRLLSERFWPETWKRARTHAMPPDDVFVGLRDRLRIGATGEESERWTAEAFRAVSTTTDTHPCLTERLRAIQGTADPRALAAAVSPTAAEVLLGGSLERLRGDVQAAWSQRASSTWREHHARDAALAERVRSLDQVNEVRADDFEASWEKTLALLRLNDRTSASHLLAALVARRPDHAMANFHLGRLLLDDGRAEGETHLERAMELDEELVPDACGLLHFRYRQTGRAEALRALQDRLDRHERERALSHIERTRVTAADTFQPHHLGATELAPLRDLLRSEGIVRADLAQKDLKYFRRQRLYVLSVHLKKPWHGLGHAEAARQVVSRLAKTVRLPGRVVVISPSGAFGALARKLRRADAQIWP